MIELLRRLHTQGVEFSIIGKYAGRNADSSFVINNLDVCVRLTFENLKKIEHAFKDLHPRHRMSANKLPLELTESLAAQLRNLYLTTDLGTLDCLGEVAGIGDFDAVLKESELTDFSFGKCYLLKTNALIRAEEAIERKHAIRAAIRPVPIQEKSE